MKTTLSAALRFYLKQQREMREPGRAGYTRGHRISKSSRTSEEESSHLLTHREEKGTEEAPMKKILIWRAGDLTPEGST